MSCRLCAVDSTRPTRWYLLAQQLGRMPAHVLPAVLEAGERPRDLGDRLLGRFGIEDDDVGRVTGREAVILEVQEARRALREHVEALAKLRRAVELQDVGVEVRNAHERAVAIGRGRVEDVVGRKRAV